MPIASEAVEFSVSHSKSIAGKTIRLEEGDITLVNADAIVNAANSRLSGGAGVDGAIHRAAGSSVMTELDGIRRKVGKCEPVRPLLGKQAGCRPNTSSTPSPRIRGGEEGEADELASCYKRML